MAEYRKTSNGRQLWKVEGSEVTIVINMKFRSSVDHQENNYFGELITNDPFYTKATEEEFNKAHAEAIAVCTLMKLV